MKTKNLLSPEEAFRSHNDGKNQDIKGRFVGQHVYCNVNTLAEYVLSKGFEDTDAPFTLDDIENYYSYPEYYGDHANFDGGGQSDLDKEVERLKEKLEALDNEYKGARLEEKQDEINNDIEALENLETEPAEIFEWWAVSDFLYRKLKENGYCVVNAGSCYIWGRTTTGQAILLDGIIGRICADMGILEGQENTWA